MAASALPLSENVLSPGTSLQTDTSSCYCFSCTAPAWDLKWNFCYSRSVAHETWFLNGVVPALMQENSFVSRYLRSNSQDLMEEQENLCLFSCSVWSQELPQGFKDFGDGVYDVTRSLYFLASRGFSYKQVLMELKYMAVPYIDHSDTTSKTSSCRLTSMAGLHRQIETPVKSFSILDFSRARVLPPHLLSSE